MATFKSPLKRLRAFIHDQTGVASIEAVLLMPLLMWAYVGTYVIYDAYKKQLDGLRSTYAIADAISREEQGLNQTYLDSMLQLMNFMTSSPSGITQRVTIVCFDETDEDYHLAWSRSTGPRDDTYPPHTDQTLNNNAHRLPDFPEGDQVILVETFMEYSPLLNIGLDDQLFDYWIFTRPRFTNQITWQGQDTWTCTG
ncbi:MAG: hypothetical protein AAGI10_07605 [Pseudomonadota bacterium]